MSLEPAGPHSEFQASLGYRLRFLYQNNKKTVAVRVWVRLDMKKEVDLTLSHHAGE